MRRAFLLWELLAAAPLPAFAQGTAPAPLASKLIRYHRGKITILDHPGRQAASCACYEMVRDMNGASKKTRSTAVTGRA